MQKRDQERFLAVLFLGSVLLLSVLQIEDTDAWMHLHLGKLLWQAKGFPASESFVYTSLQLPFSYSSWLFGLTYYLSYQALGIYGVILLKALTITAVFYILFKDALLPHKNTAVSVPGFEPHCHNGTPPLCRTARHLYHVIPGTHHLQPERLRL